MLGGRSASPAIGGAGALDYPLLVVHPALLTSLALLGPLAPAHPGAPLYVQFLIEPGAVELQLFGEQRVLNPLLGLEGQHVPPVEDEWIERLQAAAPALLASSARIAVDGTELAGVLAEAAFDGPSPANPEPTVRLRARYACDAPPERVHVAWSLFDPEGWPVPVLFRREGDPPDFLQLTRVEPACDWIARDRAAPRSGPAGAPLPPAAPGEHRGRARWRTPLIVFGVAGLAASLLRSARARRALVAAGIAGAGIAFALEAARPAPLALPGADEARAIFAALHGRIYQALAAESEEGLYELLASAVDADVLDELYGEVYEGLVLRNEGGAVCRVDEVTPLESKVELGVGGEALFEVEHAWQVRGSVGHWGHTHQRTNVYRARYTVAHDGVGWKIAAWEVLEHRRKDDARSFVTLVGEEPQEPEEEDERAPDGAAEPGGTEGGD